MKNKSQVRRNGGKSRPSSQVPNTADSRSATGPSERTPGAPAVVRTTGSGSCGTPFFDMEELVYKTQTLLHVFAKKLSTHLDAENRTYESGGITIIAAEAANSLNKHWNSAHEETVALMKSHVHITCPSASVLVLDVAKATTLLSLMAEMLCDAENEQMISKAFLKGEQPPPIEPSGYICLASEITSQLKTTFNAEFERWKQLERQMKERAAMAKAA